MEANSLAYLKAYILAKNTNIDGMEQVYTNFKPELTDTIKETKHLDRMGFKVPEIALNVALQEEKYHNFVESINSMLRSYHGVVDSLDNIEKKLLQQHLSELKRVMKPGFTRLNWNSLGIPEFIARCNVVRLI